MDPVTWMPLITAAALSVGDSDEDLSEWAADHRLFGDDPFPLERRPARREFTRHIFVTALAAPGGEGIRELVFT